MTIEDAPESRPNGADVAVAFAGVVACGLALSGAYYLGQSWLPGPDVLILLALFAEVAIIGVGVALVVRWRRLAWSDLGFRPSKRRWYGVAAAVALVVIPAALALIEPIMVRFDLPQQDLSPLLHAMNGSSGFLVVLFVMVSGAIPLAEEILFRGLLYGWLRRRWGVQVAVVLSSTLFALAHGTPESLIALVIIGALIAMLYELSDSLWPATLSHALNNGIALATAYLFP